ncbi:uncharacterized protein LOC110606826 [Manihot esculenta]|uniref:uncharacterized protein LOC110606826 n=1 Tax=Manihot esculenta TaxID=3983 RepID=UPI001CC73DA8|nr:uncharacterized protein LOC110606826 [Manihot esculenta]
MVNRRIFVVCIISSLLRSAAKECIPQERNSFVAFQASTGVEVCTFRLIVKNVSSSLDKEVLPKLEAETMGNKILEKDLMGLHLILDEAVFAIESSNMLVQLPFSSFSSLFCRKKVADALMNTISSLNKFEQGVKDCLEV